ncbi:oxidoreductase [Amylibacter ulvae]|uniref:Oxidoreductase n=1 Tax=Paramylibacter ulvae TaxID=1651968 RepID=A0ABQ3CX43_9RHOB|nr:FAD-binding oxidoreductase [Amylibacter ulvae]GHA45956.1 oxidoreductase [Amylibacter ulvae]
MSAQIQTPKQQSYDIVIIGGGIMGSSAAWFLSQDKTFDGRVLVVERDATYEFASTTHTNSCMRQQFSTTLNVRISQFAADYVKNLREYMGGDERIPPLSIRSFGYMYLADNNAFADVLRRNQKLQNAVGAATQVMDAAAIKRAYPFYNVDDIVLGSINLVDEGYWDGSTVFDWWRRKAQEAGVEYIQNEVVAITKNSSGSQVKSITLASGEKIACGKVLNASGPRAVRTSQMVGVDMPVEPRKRFSWVFSAEKPLDRDLPLTIDPSGVHVRENGGGTYQCGGHTARDPIVEYDDFDMDHDIWQDKVWPILATRIPQFDAIKVQNEWVGHYAYNTLDQNAIIGPHPEITNFYFMNGFSGHGLQQSPAMGRGIAEIMVHDTYQSLDMTPFHFDRVNENKPMVETAVI